MQEKRTPVRKQTAATGITIRHQSRCPLRESACSCHPAFQAQVWSPKDRKVIRKTFRTLSAAKAWRQDASVAVRKRTLRAPSATTLRGAWEAWLSAAQQGLIRNRSGDTYKPSTLRGYEQVMKARVLGELGGQKLSAVTHLDLQDLVDRWQADGLDASTIRNTTVALQTLYRRALARGEVSVNPTAGLARPAVRGRRDRVATPEEAATLLAALRESDRVVWATAFYAGLRRGELMALRCEDIDLTAGVIRVERSWDGGEGVVEPKSQWGRRSVPIAAVLREHLAAHALRTGRREGLVFGRTDAQPFEPVTLRERSLVDWKGMNRKRTLAELPALEPIRLHECRHTFASSMVAAGVNAKALSAYMGHASITITLDRYGHLMPGNEADAAGLLDSYLERAVARAVHAGGLPLTHVGPAVS